MMYAYEQMASQSTEELKEARKKLKETEETIAVLTLELEKSRSEVLQLTRQVVFRIIK
jgi:hypothetical protein